MRPQRVPARPSGKGRFARTTAVPSNAVTLARASLRGFR
jgi:hypothetical protein